MQTFARHVAPFVALAAVMPQPTWAGSSLWRATDAELGAVSRTGFIFSPEINDTTLHLHGPASAFLDDLKGFRAGVTVGFDQQQGKLVAGITGDAFYSWMDGKGVGAGGMSNWSRLPYMGSLRGRLGWTFGRFMAYGTGGAALAHLEIGNDVSWSSDTLLGWSGGAGIEYVWNKNLIARIEYLHADYGSSRFNTLPATQNRLSATSDPVNFHLVFRF
jgi:outer membrane immunogenic protein